MENEQWASAVSEFENALSIKTEALPAGDRQIAHLHFQMARASEAHKDDLERGGDPAEGSSSSATTPEATKAAVAAQREQARSHYEACAEVLELRLRLLAQSAAPAADAAATAAAGNPNPNPNPKPNQSPDPNPNPGALRERRVERAAG